VHRCASPHIIPARSARCPNIWFYSHTPCRQFRRSSGTFGLSPFHSLSTPDALVRICEGLYCARTHTGTYSGIHLFLSIRSLYPHSLKFSINFGSIIGHSNSFSSYSESIGTFSPLIYSFFIYILFLLLSHFSHISLTSFAFRVSDLCLFTPVFHISFSEYLRIFVQSCTCSITVVSK
jgi:hypothetical protein